MPIQIPCSGCGKTLQVADEHAGRRAACPVCQAVVDVPLRAESAGSMESGGAVESGKMTQLGETAGEPSGAPQSEEAPASGSPQPDGPEACAPLWSLQTPEGHEYGPVSKSSLDEWVIEGRVTHDCRLRQSGDVWQMADRVYACLALPRPAQPSPFAPRSPFQAEPSRAAPGNDPQPAGREATSRSKVNREPGPQEPGRTRTTPAVSESADAATGGYDALLPDRGLLIMCLAILGWFLCPILSIAAWSMATSDLEEMRAGRMDPQGRGLSQAARIVAILHIGAIVVSMIVGLFGTLVYLASKGSF